MELIFRKLREARQRDEGFTLIELLIVILVLGILAGIAVFASGPFRDRATAACGEANAQIDLIADAALDAGVGTDKASLYADQPSDCVGGGGGGPVAFAATLVSTETGAGQPATATPTAGLDNLLVAIIGHRTTPAPCDPPATADCEAPGDVGAPTAAGWTLQGYAFFQTSDQNRRGIAVFTRVATATGSDAISATWAGAGTMNLIVREFSRDTGTWANTGSFARTNEHATGSSPYALTAASGGSGSALQIAGVVGRTGPSTGSFAGFDGTTSNIANGVSLWLGHDNVTDAGSLGASFTYSGTAIGPVDGASGFVLFMR